MSQSDKMETKQRQYMGIISNRTTIGIVPYYYVFLWQSVNDVVQHEVRFTIASFFKVHWPIDSKTDQHRNNNIEIILDVSY